jgi:nucleoside 2-deoxyribosyltransferase
MKIYIASGFRLGKDAVQGITRKLVALGMACTQTWHEDSGECDRAMIAARDLREIEAADALLLYSAGCEGSHGGVHFEAGYARALGKMFFVVGEPLHIFCEIADGIYPSIQDFVNAEFRKAA